jgi:NADH dehydrogenase
VRPLAVEDLAKVLKTALVEGRLSRQTCAVMGPEQMPLGEAVRRVAGALGKRPLFLRMPVWFHYALGHLLEATMKIPLVSLAQVRILSEGIVEPLPRCASLPDDLLPSTPFTDEQIRRGLPEPGAFRRNDFRCCACHRKTKVHFLE